MNKRATVINSRQALYFCRSDSWVNNTVEAIDWIKNNNYRLVSSVGMSTWELTTALAAIKDIPLDLYLPITSNEKITDRIEKTKGQFNLNNKQINYIPIKVNSLESNKDKLFQIRDKIILENSDSVFPVSIRAGGNLNKMLKSSYFSFYIDNRFKTTYIARSRKSGYRIDKLSIDKTAETTASDYLIHWTRTFNRNWPGEKLIEFFESIIQSERYPKTAFESLKNILMTNKIYATSKNMPDNIPIVSFSNQVFTNLCELMRWRSRFMQMSFEPYGIGIKKKTALELGIHKVAYYTKHNKDVNNTPNWLRQSKGEISDWRLEKEFRYKGDLNLKEIKKEDMLLITRFQKEAAELANTTGLKCIPFTIE